MVTLTIDGKQVEIEDGATILDACQKAGANVPTLCYDKRLAPFGACRICLVELEGARTKFTPSCTTPATEGMVVRTISEEIKKARQTVLELLLINHPLDCPVCDKAGECTLQDLVYEYGVSKSRFKGEKLDLPVDRLSPLIERNLSRCILCGKCVRVCEEIVDVAEISFVNRGIQAKIGTDFDRPLNCEFCGQCIDACPVGALTSRLFKYKARLWELKKTRTVCSFCSTGCSITLGVKDGQILEAYNEKDVGVNGRHLCSKGRFGWQYVHNPQRLTTPLIRKENQLIEASWEEALTEVAERFGYFKETYGSQSLAGLASARLTNEELYLFQKFMRLGLGTNNLDHSGGGWAASAEVLKKSLGFAASTNSIKDIGKADLILVLAGDVSSTNPVVAMEITRAVKREQIPLMVINPRQTKLLRRATYPLMVKPGREVALLNGMINLIVDEDIFDRKFVSSKTEGSKALKHSVIQYTPEYVEQLTGITKEQLARAAKAYARADKAIIILDGEDRMLIQAAINLALLTGNIGQEAAGIIIVGEKSNCQGAIDMGVSSKWLPGTAEVDDVKARKKLGEAWGRQLPSSPGVGVAEILNSAERGEVKALYVIGENPIASYPDPNHTEQALKSLNFLVVQDIFLTETAKLANVVLPAVSFAEKDGTFTNLERRVQRLNVEGPLPVEGPHPVAVPPCGRADWQIIQELSNKLGLEMNYESPEEIMAEITKVVPFYEGITYELCGRSTPIGNNGIQWSDTPTSSSGWKVHSQASFSEASFSGASFLYKDGFPKAKAIFQPTEYEPVANDKDYPFLLISGQSIFHSGSMSRYSAPLCQLYPEPLAEINPLDAQNLGISNESQIKVTSIEGSIEIKAKLTQKSPPGVIFIPINPQNLVHNLVKPDSEKPIRVKVEAAS